MERENQPKLPSIWRRLLNRIRGHLAFIQLKKIILGRSTDHRNGRLMSIVYVQPNGPSPNEDGRIDITKLAEGVDMDHPKEKVDGSPGLDNVGHPELPVIDSTHVSTVGGTTIGASGTRELSPTKTILVESPTDPKAIITAQDLSPLPDARVGEHGHIQEKRPVELVPLSMTGDQGSSPTKPERVPPATTGDQASGPMKSQRVLPATTGDQGSGPMKPERVPPATTRDQSSGPTKPERVPPTTTRDQGSGPAKPKWVPPATTNGNQVGSPTNPERVRPAMANVDQGRGPTKPEWVRPVTTRDRVSGPTKPERVPPVTTGDQGSGPMKPVEPLDRNLSINKKSEAYIRRKRSERSINDSNRPSASYTKLPPPPPPPPPPRRL